MLATAMLAACGSDLTLPGDGGTGGPPAGPETPGATLSVLDDRYSTVEGVDRTLTIPSPGVLGNDLVNGSASGELRAALVAGPVHGQVQLGADGSLSYTPEAGWFGTDRFTYRASLGSAASADAAVAVEVEPLNDSPAFSAGPDQEAKREAGKEKDEEGGDGRAAVTVDGWASDIRPGPPNEADQSVAFLVTVTSGSESLIGAPLVSSTGTLRYSPSDQEGTALVEVRLRDDGGTANGGQDTSPPHMLIIVVRH